MRLSSLIVVGLAVIAVVFIVGAAVFTYVGVRQFVADSPIQLPTLNLNPLDPAVQSATAVPTLVVPSSQPPAATPVAGSSAPNPSPSSLNAPTASPSVLTTPTIDSALLTPRVTILLLGTDQRPGEKDPPRTDTIILLSIDPIRKTAAMLSIPRDIYMQIPGYGTDRINTAYATGIANDYPGGAPLLAAKAVQSLVGVSIQHYFLLNFDVFYAAIDAIGPIQVCPPTAIHDANYPDNNYGFITVDFPAGCQELDSIKLLEYSRVRHNAGDDFGRASRQQEVIRAVRAKVLSLGGISALIGKAGTIWGTVKTSVQTDMTFDQMLQLAQIGLTIPQQNVSSAVLTDKGDYLIPSTTPDGQQVLSPIYENIHGLVEKMFDAEPGKPVVDEPPGAAGSAAS